MNRTYEVLHWVDGEWHPWFESSDRASARAEYEEAKRQNPGVKFSLVERRAA